MTKQVQRRRGTATQHTSFTGAEGELSVNTTNKSVHVHDGATAGGIELARKDGSNVAFTSGTLDGVTIGGTTAGAGTFTNLTATGTTTLAGASTSADITFGDNDKAIFGAGSDLQIYHVSADNTSRIVESGAGNLIIQGTNLRLGNADFSRAYFAADDGGAATIYYNDAPKLATTSTGVDITGTLVSDGLTVDGTSPAVATLNSTSNGVRIEFNGASTPASRPWEVGVLNNADGDFQIYQAADLGAGDIKLYTDGVLRQNIDAQTGDISFFEDTGTTAKLVWKSADERLGIGASSPFSTSQILNTGWSSGAPYGTVLTVTGNNTNDANWGHLLISDSTTTTGNGGSLRFAVGSTELDLSPHAGIDGYTEGANYGGLKFLTRPNGGTSTTRMTIDSIGNVGIGVSSIAGVKMDVLATASDNLVARFENNHATGSYGISVKAGDDSGNYAADFANKSGTSLMRIRGDGNVGIGTTSPASLLHLEAAEPIIRFKDSDGSAYHQIFGNTTDLYIDADRGNNATSNIIFRNDADEKMRLNNSGHLLVGTADAGIYDDATDEAGHNLLANGQYYNSAVSEINMILNKQNSDGDIVQFRRDGTTTVGSIGANGGDIYIGTGDTTLKFVDGADLIAPTGTDAATRDGLISLGNSSNRFKNLYLSGSVFSGATSGGAKVVAEAVATGTTYSASWPATGGTALYMQVNSSAVGSITTTASATAYNTSSDYRLKENVVDLTGATDRIKQIPVHRFNFIADPDTTVDGFLAHEVQDIVPEAVTGAKDAMRDEEYEVTPAVLDDNGNVVTEAVMGTRSVPDYQGIDQSKLVPLLVATIKELEARITALENA